MNLNEEQKAAAEINTTNSLILAGPGTGKTTALVGRYQYLLNKGIDPKAILCCTFARKASDELKSRIEKETGVQTKTLPIGTFHALANRAVRQLAHLINVEVPETILSEFQRRQIIFDLKNLIPEELKKIKFEDQTPSSILETIDGFREKLLTPEEASIEAGENGDSVLVAHAEIYALYDKHLTDEKLIDYARMIQFAVKAFSVDAEGDQKFIRQFKHILVDEFQDINFAQKVMIDKLLKGGAALWAVGDDDQAIYGWRGSSVDYILNFDKYYQAPGFINLKKNYRAAPELVAASKSLARHFVRRRDKQLVSTVGTAGRITIRKFFGETNEAEQLAKTIKTLKQNGTAYREIGILARTNALPSVLVDRFIADGIPVSLKNGVAAFQSDQTRELIAASAIASSQQINRAWNRKINSKLFGFAKKLEAEDVWERKVKALTTSIIRGLPASVDEEEKATITEKLENCRDFLCSFDDPTAAFRHLEASTKQQDDAVHIGTIHGSKGLEWATVFVIGCEEGLLPHSLAEGFSQIEEERRLFYVAITRAKTSLYLSYLTERDSAPRYPSPYISEMQADAEINSGRISDNDFSELLKKMRRYGEEVDQFKRDHPSSISTAIADGLGEGSGWQINDTGKGFLSEVGYTAKRNGPDASARHEILAEVFHGKLSMPASIQESIAEQWGEPNTTDRLRKIRNTINVALGTQKARTNPSEQAIKKWEEDLHFIDAELNPQLGDQT